MKRLMAGVTMIALLTGTVAIADPHKQRNAQAESTSHGGRQAQSQRPRQDNGRHLGWGRDRGNYARWGRGQRMGYNDWRNARRIDYRRHNLRQPPRGYEWRRSNDRYVLVGVGTGLIISVILVSGR